MDLFGIPEYCSIWDVARHWAGRPLLSKLLKEHGKASVKAAALKTLEHEAVEQLPYFLELLKGGDAPTQPWQESNEQLYLMAQERGISTSGKSRQELISALR